MPFLDSLLAAGKTIGGSIISQFAGGILGGDSGGGGGQGGSAASAAALARIGFAEEKRTAMQMAENAARRGEQRKYAPGERRESDSKYVQEIARMYQKAFQDSSVREALVQQLNRQGQSSNISVASAYDFRDAEPQIDPQKIA